MVTTSSNVYPSLDLSVVLPVHLLAGVALMVMMGHRGFPIGVGPLGVMIAVALLNAGATAALLRRVSP